MVLEGLWRILLSPIVGMAEDGAGAAVAGGSAIPENSLAFAIAAVAALAIAFAVQRLVADRRKFASATHMLAQLAHRLKAGEPPDWTPTGVADVDAIARTLEEFDQRLRRKRSLLTRLNAELIRGGIGGANGFPNQLRAIIDALPVGVLARRGAERAHSRG